MIYCFFSLNNEKLKFAFSSSKVFKTKVIKNKIKRQLRSIVFSTNEWLKDLNIIFIAKKNYKNFSYEDVKKNINIIKKKIEKEVNKNVW